MKPSHQATHRCLHLSTARPPSDFHNTSQPLSPHRTLHLAIDCARNLVTAHSYRTQNSRTLSSRLARIALPIDAPLPCMKVLHSSSDQDQAPRSQFDAVLRAGLVGHPLNFFPHLLQASSNHSLHPTAASQPDRTLHLLGQPFFSLFDILQLFVVLLTTSTHSFRIEHLAATVPHRYQQSEH